MERDLAVFGYIFAMENFNSHAHVERDPCQSIARARVVYFNSHAHVERDDDMLTCVFEVINFNSHAHVERDE